jgi:hypothetical protein
MEEQYSKIPFTCAKCGSKLVAIQRVHLDSMAAGITLPANARNAGQSRMDSIMRSPGSKWLDFTSEAELMFHHEPKHIEKTSEKDGLENNEFDLEDVLCICIRSERHAQ